jgi:hypothetical protein
LEKAQETPETKNGTEDDSHSLLIKPLGTADLLRQLEARLVQQADKQLEKRALSAKVSHARHPA